MKTYPNLDPIHTSLELSNVVSSVKGCLKYIIENNIIWKRYDGNKVDPALHREIFAEDNFLEFKSKIEKFPGKLSSLKRGYLVLNWYNYHVKKAIILSALLSNLCSKSKEADIVINNIAFKIKVLNFPYFYQGTLATAKENKKDFIEKLQEKSKNKESTLYVIFYSESESDVICKGKNLEKALFNFKSYLSNFNLGCLEVFDLKSRFSFNDVIWVEDE